MLFIHISLCTDMYLVLHFVLFQWAMSSIFQPSHLKLFHSLFLWKNKILTELLSFCFNVLPYFLFPFDLRNFLFGVEIKPDHRFICWIWWFTLNEKKRIRKPRVFLVIFFSSHFDSGRICTIHIVSWLAFGAWSSELETNYS